MVIETFSSYNAMDNQQKYMALRLISSTFLSTVIITTLYGTYYTCLSTDPRKDPVFIGYQITYYVLLITVVLVSLGLIFPLCLLFASCSRFTLREESSLVITQMVLLRISMFVAVLSVYLSAGLHGALDTSTTNVIDYIRVAFLLGVYFLDIIFSAADIESLAVVRAPVDDEWI